MFNQEFVNEIKPYVKNSIYNVLDGYAYTHLYVNTSEEKAQILSNKFIDLNKYESLGGEVKWNKFEMTFNIKVPYWKQM